MDTGSLFAVVVAVTVVVVAVVAVVAVVVVVMVVVVVGCFVLVQASVPFVEDFVFSL